MKCFVVLIVLCIIGEGFAQEMNSLSAISLVMPRIQSFSEMCSNRTASTSVSDQLQQAIEDCQTAFFNGTELSYSSLVSTDTKEFYELYKSQCTEPSAIRARNECTDNLKYILKQCLNETELLAFNKIEDTTLRIYKLICDMDQDKMKQFFSLKGQECLSDYVITIGYCFLSVFPDDDEARQHFLFNLIDGKECKAIEDAQRCLMPELESCDEKVISHVFNLLFDFFKQECAAEPIEEPQQDHVFTSGATQYSPALLTSIFIALFFSIH